MKKLLFIVGLLFLIVIPSKAYAINEVNVYYFYSDTCNICSQENIYLQALKKRYPNMRIYSYNTGKEENRDLLNQVKQIFNVNTSGVPFTVIGDTSYIGFSQGKKGNMQKSVYDYSLNTYQDKVGKLVGITYNSNLDGKVEEYKDNEDYVIEENSGKEHTSTSKMPESKVKKYQASVLLVSIGVILALLVLLISILERRRNR